jgi:hypothetical protein
MIETITLGGHAFCLKPLTLGALRPLLDALDAMAGAGGGTMPGNMIDAAARILQAGLAAAQPEVTLDDVLALEATVPEVNAAVAAVLRVAGLIPPGESKSAEPKPGEAQPVATTSDPGSAPSTAPSPPAAAIPTETSTA